MDKSINIISLDVPYPPNYGGAIDIFYKLTVLHKLGVKIYLHCFDYGRGKREALEAYCEKVFYYERNTGILSNLSLIPYITYSRRSRLMQENLQSNNYPILLEGLHSVYPMLKNRLENRVIVLRSHNIEHDYYYELARRETNLIKKIYFYKESLLLKRLLKKLSSDLKIGAISPSDTEYLKKSFPNTFWLPPFHSNQQLQIFEGKGEYALYHGNLSVSENYEVANLLINQFANKNIKFVIAGKEPNQELINRVKSIENVQLIKNPDHESMLEIIRSAQVILLPTNQSTGIKLKLIESLFNGKHCVANDAMINNTRLESLVSVENVDYYSAAEKLMGTELSKADLEHRTTVLNMNYNNVENAKRLLQKLSIDILL